MDSLPVDNKPGLPLVSIVIPSYNCAQFLPECVESCLAQSYSNLEIILVDDGSSDNTRAIVEPYLEKITYFYQDNTGLAGARNVGHALARGEYVAWLDADDIAHPERISLQAAYLEKHPQAVLVCANFSAFDETGKEYSEYATRYYSQLSAHNGISGLLAEVEDVGSDCRIKAYSGDGHLQLILGNFIHPPTVMIRKEACRQAGELRRDIPTQEDWEYFFRITQFGRMAWIDQPLLRYRLHSQQMSSTANAVINATGIVRVFEEILQSEPTFAKANKRRVRKMLGRFCAGAVYTLLEDGRKVDALAYLKKGFLCNPLSLQNYKLLAKWFLVQGRGDK